MKTRNSLGMAGAMIMAVLALAPAARAHDGVHIEDAYLRIATPTAKTAAAFLMIRNHQMQDDRLLSITTDAADVTELHTHVETGDGVMQMRGVEGGITVPGNGSHALARGGDHVMLMGLTRPLSQGDVVTLVLTFERAGVVTVDVPVDNAHPDGVISDAPMEADMDGMDHGTVAADAASADHDDGAAPAD